jgi:hypothetical protein
MCRLCAVPAVPSCKNPEHSVLSTFKRLENEFPVLLLLQSRQRRKEYSQKPRIIRTTIITKQARKEAPAWCNMVRDEPRAEIKVKVKDKNKGKDKDKDKGKIKDKDKD